MTHWIKGSYFSQSAALEATLSVLTGKSIGLEAVETRLSLMTATFDS